MQKIFLSVKKFLLVKFIFVDKKSKSGGGWLVGWSVVVGRLAAGKKKTKFIFFYFTSAKSFFIFFIYFFIFVFVVAVGGVVVVFPGMVFFYTHAHAEGGGPGLSMLVPTILTRGEKRNLDKILTKFRKKEGA